jgi:Holliday junction resolvasome RuvABC ATP-dependent DNA helicase subunit
MISPTNFRATRFADLIGPAAALGRVLQSKVDRTKADPTAIVKAMFYGAPGVGKTELSRIFALALADHEFAIE